MGIQSALATVGVGKQSAKGSAAAAATFAHGLTSGTIITVDVSQSADDRTSGVRASQDANRTAVVPGFDVASRVHPKSVGAWLYGALGAIATSGTGPYTHTITMGSDLPYLSLFGTYAGNYYKVQDCKVDSASLAWSGNEPLEVKVSGMGTALSVLAAVYTTTNDEVSASYFTPVGGTFTVDVDGGGAATASSKITSGEITINNNADTVLVAGSITPDDVVVGRQDIGVKFDIVPNDFALWRTIVTGSPSGTSIASGVVYGSFSMQFTNGTDTITLTSSRVAFTCDFPSVDPQGGTATLSLSGIALSASGGSPLTATVVNTQTSY